MVWAVPARMRAAGDSECNFKHRDSMSSHTRAREQLESDPPCVQAGTVEDWESVALNSNRYGNLLTWDDDCGDYLFYRTARQSWAGNLTAEPQHIALESQRLSSDGRTDDMVVGVSIFKQEAPRASCGSWFGGRLTSQVEPSQSQARPVHISVSARSSLWCPRIVGYMTGCFVIQ